MIEWLKVVLFGIVEGITEWLPISSTGHLILLNTFLPLQASAKFTEMFTVVIQLGAILAVVVYFFQKLNPWDTHKDIYQRHQTIALWLKVIVATVPAAIIGYLLDDWMDAHLYNAWVISLMLVLYGVAFIIVERKRRHVRPAVRTLSAIDYRLALLMGMFQVLALVPGTSRSGATIIGGLLLGMARSVAAEFSFFMSIPVMFGASALKLVKFGFAFSATEVLYLLTGMIVAFAVSVLVIRFLMGYIKKHDFTVFGLYRIVLGIVLLLVMSL